MTVAEAVGRLKNLHLGDDIGQDDIGAIKLLISAREACIACDHDNDTISRAEAQTALQFAARRYTVANEAHGEGRVVWSDNLISVADAMNALRDLPSSQPEIIRCKDCKHKPHTSDKYDYDNHDCGFEIIFPDYRCPCQCDDGYYNHIPDDDWYCGNAERREE